MTGDFGYRLTNEAVNELQMWLALLPTGSVTEEAIHGWIERRWANNDQRITLILFA